MSWLISKEKVLSELETGSTLKQPFTSIVEDYNFIQLLTEYPDEPNKIKFSREFSLQCILSHENIDHRGVQPDA
jgi:hypothetical protein